MHVLERLLLRGLDSRAREHRVLTSEESDSGLAVTLDDVGPDRGPTAT